MHQNNVLFVFSWFSRRRLSENLAHTPTSFRRDPEDPSAVALKEPWEEKVRWVREHQLIVSVPCLCVLTCVCVCVCVQADQRSVSVRSPAELEAAVRHREVWRRPEAGAAGLSGAPTAAGIFLMFVFDLHEIVWCVLEVLLHVSVSVGA